MQNSKTAATTIMAPGSGPSDLGPVDAAIRRQRKLIAEYRSLREEYLGRYKEVLEEKQRTTMEAESCVSIAHEAHRVMRRLEKQLQLLLDPPSHQLPDMPATNVPSSCKRAPTSRNPLSSAAQAGVPAGSAWATPCLQEEVAAIPASNNTGPASKPSAVLGMQPRQPHQQQLSTSPQKKSSSAAGNCRSYLSSSSVATQPLDYDTQLQQELEAYGRTHGIFCGLTTNLNSSSATTTSTSRSQPRSTYHSSDSTPRDQLPAHHTWSSTCIQYQRVQPDGTLDGAIAALNAMLTDPTLNSLVAKYAPHAARPTAWHAAAAAAPILDQCCTAASSQCLQDSASCAEPPSPGQPSGAAPLVAGVVAAAGRRRLLQEQRKRQELHTAAWQRLQETAAAHTVNKLCRRDAQKHAGMRIRARRFLQPGSLQAQEDRQELQLARQAMGRAPRLQEGRSRVLLWLEKRHSRMSSSWQRKYERLGGRAAVWMVCTVEPWLARVQGRARAALGAAQQALLPSKHAAAEAEAEAVAAPEPAAAAAATGAAGPAPVLAGAPCDLEAGLVEAGQAPLLVPTPGQRPTLFYVFSVTSKATAAALQHVRNNIRNPASFVLQMKLQLSEMLHAANQRVEAAHRSSEAAAAAAAIKGSTAARKLLVTLLPFMMNAAEQEEVKKQQDEVKNRRRLSPQEGYSWDVYPTLGAVLEEKLEFESAAARAGQGAVPEADAFEASRLGVGDLQERQKRRAPVAASSARAAAEARALQDMQAALQRRQQWQLASLEWKLRLQLAATHVPLMVSLATSSSSSNSEAAAQLAAVVSARSAIQRNKQADKAAASLASQLKFGKDSLPPPMRQLAAGTALVQWKQQQRQARAWRMRQCTRSMTAAALHAARGIGMQVGGGRGYELDEEYEEWEDNLPFELGRLQQHPQLINHLAKEHQAAHERDLAQHVPAPVQPSNSSSAWLRKHDTSSSVTAWLGSGVRSLLGSSSSSSGTAEGDGGISLDDAALFAEAPAWETSMDAMTPEYAEVAAVVLQAEGRYDAGCAVWPPAIYDHTDSGCCRKVSRAEGAPQQPQAATGRPAIEWQLPVVQQQQQLLLPATASTEQLTPEMQKAAVAATAASVPPAAAGEAEAPVAGSPPARQQPKRHSSRPASPAAEGRTCSRRSSGAAIAAAKPVKAPAALPKHHLSSGAHSIKQVSSSSSSGSASAGKLMPHHKRNMSAIQEEDELAGHSAAARTAKLQQASQCEIEAADSEDEEQQVDCSAASDASLHFEHVMVA
uniref:Uncharacterized protein n=1 Tax=Tetradesmus obliquus TaxID=3088 RepID=A0A383W3V7_TETOB|eukprot:jgi/Sobl393_1/406/SZX71694.1